ncbi:MAG: glutamine-hydrolyzing GMP synthase [Leptotrichiaceae bacterium]|jgi:GMP synthase (glutamine-hydrolysing)|nr:glutamine-hydrolyzing GMP synthase [Leptotrichiaceae bacterium]MBP7025936.1 glutamine-hydrolyzing GMP synthase [Leptotrichiaceae bacterium]MBP9876317.1 glutamine-hydrolyzing GMP synthase [Leptotrichiaceae bacterium]
MKGSYMKEKVIIIDFGSQYSQLIARRIREMEVYCEITHEIDVDAIKSGREKVKGIIFSGGPASVYEEGAPTVNKEVFELGLPILGICYGMQLITHLNGGKVEKAESREFGKAILEVLEPQNDLLVNVKEKSQVWMSHGDHVTELPKDFTVIAKTDSSIAAITNNKGVYALQFHPEVVHSEEGAKLIENFLFNVCKCEKNWKIKSFIEEKTKQIKETVGNEHVILGLSGGVDSSVAAVLINNAIHKQLTCVFVDTGLLRKDEGKKVLDYYKEHFDLNIIFVDAKDRFLNKLKGVDEPEAKRKIIGNEFIEVFSEETRKLKGEGAKFLAQGTIYPDVIESQSVKGPSHTIKSHHNVGGLPEDLAFELLEPLKELFKDEVRRVGGELGLPEFVINRHPFPGPGLGIRVIGEVDAEKVKILQEADDIFINELIDQGFYGKVNQAFVALLPVKSVGVMGDQRTYEYTAVVRSVDTIDFMTATWSKLPYEFLETVSNKIINKVNGINRVVYDISSKPPATIEWE